MQRQKHIFDTKRNFFSLENAQNNNKKDFFEKKAWSGGCVIIGADEAGKGPLAGPLTLAAVILPPCAPVDIFSDSKKMTPRARAKTFLWINQYAIFSYVNIHPRVLEKHGMTMGNVFALKKLLANFRAICPEKFGQLKMVLLDFMHLKKFHVDIEALEQQGVEVLALVKGESKSISIAAASIVAKESRDLLMQKLSSLNPGFSLEKHKGYASSQHINCLKNFGTSLMHRKNFVHTVLSAKNNVL
jgi:ribonuclease HII